jgi:hypothetical protein
MGDMVTKGGAGLVEAAGSNTAQKNTRLSGYMLPSAVGVGKMEEIEKSKVKEPSKEATVKKLKLMDFSGDDNLAPELIDDALNSTSTFYKNINMPDLARRIKSNKAKYGRSIP